MEREDRAIDKLLGDLEEAASRKDSEAVCKLLGCSANPPSVLNGSLIAPIGEALRVLDELRGVCQSRRLSQFYGIFLPLLLVNPCYEVPWSACHIFVSEILPAISVAESDEQSLSMCIDDMVMYFRDYSISCKRAKSHISDVSREVKHGDTRTASHWILRILHEILQPKLFKPPVRPNVMRNTFGYLHATLYHTISIGIEVLSHFDRDAHTTALEMLFSCHLQVHQLTPWILVVMESYNRLRTKDNEAILDLVLQVFQRCSVGDIPIMCGYDVARMVETLIRLLRTVCTDRTGRAAYDKVIRWISIILHLMQTSSADFSLYAEVEQTLNVRLPSLPSSFVGTWNEALMAQCTSNTFPKWTVLNLIKIEMSSNHRKRSRAIIKGICLGREMEYCAIDFCAHLFACLGDSLMDDIPRELRHVTFGNDDVNIGMGLRCLKLLLYDVLYTGQGAFITSTGLKSGGISELGAKICDSLLISNSEPWLITKVEERAESWVEIIDSILERRCEQVLLYHLLFATVVYITIYFEVTSFRARLMERISNRFLHGNKLGSTNKFCCFQAMFLVIVRSTRFKDLHLSAALQKSGSIVEGLRPVLRLLSTPVSEDHYYALISCLSQLPQARNDMLSFSSSCLSVRNNQSETKSACSLSLRDRYRRGLFSCFRLLSSSFWGENENIAWKAVADAIVSDNPRLPLPTHLWFFRYMQHLASGQRLSLKPAKHLLRAAVVRLVLSCSQNSSFFHFNHRGYEHPTAVREEYTSELTLLIFALMNVVANRNERKAEYASMLSRNYRDFLSDVLSWYSQAVYHENSQQRKLSSDQLNGTEDDFVWTCRIVLDLITAVLRPHEADRRSESAISPKLDDIVSKLVFFETQELREKKYRPAWVTRFPMSPRPPKTIFGTQIPMMAMSKSCTYNLLLRMFFDPNAITSGVFQSINATELSSNALLTFQRTSMLATRCPKRDVIKLYSGTIELVSSSFTRFSSQVLSSAIAETRSLSDVDTLLYSVMEFCTSFCKLDNHNEGHRGWSRFLDWPESLAGMFQGFWSVYDVVGTEAALNRLITYLESSRTDGEIEDNDDTNVNVYSIQNIGSIDQIDTIARNIRLNAIQSVDKCLGLFVDGGFPFIPNTDLLSSNQAVTLASTEQDPSHIFPLLQKSLVTLCIDLRLAFEGKSGGITGEILSAYIQAIRKCCSIIPRIIDFAKDTTCLERVLVTNTDAAKNLLEILTCFSVDDPEVIDHTLNLVYVSFPSLCRLARRQLCSLQVHSTSSCASNSDQVSNENNGRKIGECFMTCLSLLVMEKTSTQKNGSNIAESAVSLTASMDTQNLAKGGRTSIGMNDKEFRATIQLCAPIEFPTELWIPVVLSFVDSVADNWGESLRVVRDGNEGKWGPKVPQLAERYCHERRNELVYHLSGIVLLFQPLVIEKLGKKKGQNPLTPVAAILPIEIVTKALQAMTVVSDVLLQSVRYLISATALCFENKSKFEAVLTESISCLGAWLHLEDAESNFFEGMDAWYRVSMRNTSEARSYYTLLDTKAMMYLEENMRLNSKLVLELKRLSETLNSESAIARIASQLLGMNGNVSDALFHAILARKVGLLKGAKLSNPAIGLPLKREETTKSGKNSSRKAQKTESNRKIRSRNRTVDAWLELDKDMPPEEETQVDAFADLEDFIVDG